MKEFRESVSDVIGDHDVPTVTNIDKPHDGYDDTYDLLFPAVDDGEIEAESDERVSDLDDIINQDEASDETMLGMKVQLPTLNDEILEGVVVS